MVSRKDSSSNERLPTKSSRDPAASTAAALTTSRSNPLARATPRAKRAKPASRSTHKTLLKCFSFPSLGVSSPSPPTDETSDAASTLILGPSERSSKAPRSAPARFRTAEMPRASRRATTTSFQRATPSAPHSA